MAEARGRSQWNHTAALLAQTANIHRDHKKRKRPFQPADFNPYTARPRRKRAPVTAAGMTANIMAIVRARQKRVTEPSSAPPEVPPLVR